MRSTLPMVRLVALMLYSVGALAALVLVSAHMAARYLGDSTEHAVRRLLAADAPIAETADRAIACRVSESGEADPADCDLRAILSQHPLRSVRCRDKGIGRMLESRWPCLAKFHDGSTLPIEVTLGLAGRRYELLLPVQTPEAESSSVRAPSAPRSLDDE